MALAPHREYVDRFPFLPWTLLTLYSVSPLLFICHTLPIHPTLTLYVLNQHANNTSAKFTFSFKYNNTNNTQKFFRLYLFTNQCNVIRTFYSKQYMRSISDDSLYNICKKLLKLYRPYTDTICLATKHSNLVIIAIDRKLIVSV